MSHLNTAIIEDLPLSVIRPLINDDSIESETPEGYTPIMVATHCKRPDVVTLLIRNGANANHQSENGDTALHIATVDYNEQIAALLVEADADVNLENEEGYTPAMLAAYRGYLGIILLLNAFGARFDYRNRYGDSAYSEAVRGGSTDVLDFLCEQDPTHESCYSSPPQRLA